MSRFEITVVEHTSCKTCPHHCSNLCGNWQFGCRLQQKSGGRLWYDNPEDVFKDCMFLPTVNPLDDNARLREAIEKAPHDTTCDYLRSPECDCLRRFSGHEDTCMSHNLMGCTCWKRDALKEEK